MRGKLRPFTMADLPGVVALYGRVYPARRDAGLPRRAAYLERILTGFPWRAEHLPSLVYEDGGGTVLGFLGVMPRKMLFADRPIWAAVSHHFMVDPSVRATLAAVALMKRFLAGPQELSLCEPASGVVRDIWESLGGATSVLHGMRWTRPLRPAAFTLLRLNHRLPRWAGRAAVAGGRLVDVALERLPASPLRLPTGARAGEDLSAASLLAAIEQFSRRFSLRPAYDLEAVEWLLATLEQQRGWGVLRGRLVRGERGDPVGHHLYYLQPGGVSELVQLGAQTGRTRDVLSDAARDARERGSVALCGWLEPRYAIEASEWPAYARHGGNRLLFHAREPRLTGALYGGDAFLTQLEGEWWIPFREASIPA